MIEYYFDCPYCWEHISMLVDLSIAKQAYIEDCEVCCNPIQITIKLINAQIIEFQADSIGQ